MQDITQHLFFLQVIIRNLNLQVLFCPFQGKSDRTLFSISNECLLVLEIYCIYLVVFLCVSFVYHTVYKSPPSIWNSHLTGHMKQNTRNTLNASQSQLYNVSK